MKIKNLLSILILNVFLMFMVSLYQEYISLQRTFKGLDETFDMAVETAIDASTASEEMFSDRFDSAISSNALSYDKSRYVYSTTKVFRNGQWITGNLYIMAMYYNRFGTFPTSQAAYNSYASGVDTANIYEYLFGDIGSDYKNGSLSWANTSSGITIANSTSRYVTNSNFSDFYNSVGKLMKTSMYCKVKDGNTYSISKVTVPTLTQMGLKLNSYNDVTSTTTHDDFTSSYHIGNNKNRYYLTPYSLGVTYVPVEVLKPTILSHLEQLIRFSKCKVSSTDVNSADMLSAYGDADGCIPTSMYDTDTDTHKVHKYVSNTRAYVQGATDILNDGEVEYDMSTLQVKVDYFYMDLYSASSYKVLNYLIGAVPYSVNFSSLPELYKQSDTSGSTTNYRIVAKVTTKIKLHVPYKSGILQWVIDKTSTNTNEHYDIPLWNNVSKNIVENSDGIWYQYTTYTAITR